MCINHLRAEYLCIVVWQECICVLFSSLLVTLLLATVRGVSRLMLSCMLHSDVCACVDYTARIGYLCVVVFTILSLV